MFVQSVAHDANVGTPDAANAGTTSSRQVGKQRTIPGTFVSPRQDLS